MSEPSEPRTLQELVTAFEQKGAKALGTLLERPVLIHCNTSSRKSENWGFETRTAPAPWDMRVALALARGGRVASPELLSKATAVYTVSKRQGGPFPERIGIGRARTADVSLRHSSVSKYHAYLSFDEAKQCWMLWDAGSRNGTTVGERRLDSGAGVPLENGTSIVFGENMLLFFDAPGFRKLVESLAHSMPRLAR